MAATATARRATATRRAAATKRRRSGQARPGFVPVTAAAGAVGGVADSGLFVWLTRGRLWIGLVGTLLVGIVGLNVMALSFSASSSNAGQAADALKRQNSALRAEIAGKLTNSEIQRVAARLALVMPGAGSFRYLRSSPSDAEHAAERLRNGDLVAGVSSAAIAPIDTTATTTTVAAPPVDTTLTTAPVTDPATVASAPVATAPVSETTAPPATTAPASGGAVGAP